MCLWPDLVVRESYRPDFWKIAFCSKLEHVGSSVAVSVNMKHLDGTVFTSETGPSSSLNTGRHTRSNTYDQRYDYLYLSSLFYASIWRCINCFLKGLGCRILWLICSYCNGRFTTYEAQNENTEDQTENPLKC